jgi:hypothetical protein
LPTLNSPGRPIELVEDLGVVIVDEVGDGNLIRSNQGVFQPVKG